MTDHSLVSVCLDLSITFQLHKSYSYFRRLRPTCWASSEQQNPRLGFFLQFFHPSTPRRWLWPEQWCYASCRRANTQSANAGLVRHRFVKQYLVTVNVPTLLCLALFHAFIAHCLSLLYCTYLAVISSFSIDHRCLPTYCDFDSFKVVG